MVRRSKYKSVPIEHETDMLTEAQPWALALQVHVFENTIDISEAVV